MGVKMDIALRKWTLSPMRHALEGSPKYRYTRILVVSLQLASVIYR